MRDGSGGTGCGGRGRPDRPRVGLDLNVGMLEVARNLDASAERVPGDPEPAAIEWIEASAEAVPLASRSFDVFLSGQAMQFLPDTVAAAGEVRRLLRPAGRLAVSVWRAPSSSPLFAAEIETIAERLGVDAARSFAAGFRLADPAPLVDALSAAGLEGVELGRIDLILNLPPLADWAPRHLAATPVAPALASATPGLARELGADIAQALAEYVTPDGVRVPFSSWVIQAVAPSV